jgi:hypothetical protein
VSEPFCLDLVASEKSAGFAGMRIEADVLVDSPTQLLLQEEFPIISFRQWEWTDRIIDDVPSLQSFLDGRIDPLLRDSGRTKCSRHGDDLLMFR